VNGSTVRFARRSLIDGTHGAAALLSVHQASPTLPWEAVVVDSPGMTDYRWHIGFCGTSQNLRDLSDLADHMISGSP
jgi:hypothetical protein